MKTKVLAFYLPQFHETEYNNEWWGKGFTDWVASKNATPLFKGHRQPRTPLDANYYDLSDESAKAIAWQASLAKSNGIDGFCIYHYWFPSGAYLDTPAQILLNHSEIDIEYSFCWDSGSWKRTWTLSDKQSEILVQQDYGNRDRWKAHYEYLRPFFLDSRYIKINNRPVFHIYRSLRVECLNEMRKCWDEMASQDGFDGVYIIAGDLEYRKDEEKFKAVDAFYNYEPNFSFSLQYGTIYNFGHLVIGAIKKRFNRLFGTLFLPDKRNAGHIFSVMERYVPASCKKENLGIFTDYDDTPRRKGTGVVYCNNSVNLFKKAFRVQYEKSIANHSDFLYITAWNEWGESAYLEPDEEKEFAYLNVIKETVSDKNGTEVL